MVRAELKACESRGVEIGIETVKKEFVAMAFSTGAEFKLSDSALESMASFGRAIENTQAKDPCRDYFFAMADSLGSFGRVLDLINSQMASSASLAFHKRDIWLKAMSDLLMSVAIAKSDPRLQR